MQDVFLFSDTINSNVKLGKRANTHNDLVQKALERAQAKDFIERMEEQYETQIVEATADANEFDSQPSISIGQIILFAYSVKRKV